jgi:hypothetical protein
MTKEQFLAGTPFYIGKKSYNGDSTFTYDGGSICKQSRSSIDEKVIIDSYHCNVTKVGRTGFEGFAFILGKRVQVKLKFAALAPFSPETSVGE